MHGSLRVLRFCTRGGEWHSLALRQSRLTCWALEWSEPASQQAEQVVVVSHGVSEPLADATFAQCSKPSICRAATHQQAGDGLKQAYDTAGLLAVLQGVLLAGAGLSAALSHTSCELTLSSCTQVHP